MAVESAAEVVVGENDRVATALEREPPAASEAATHCPPEAACREEATGGEATGQEAASEPSQEAAGAKVGACAADGLAERIRRALESFGDIAEKGWTLRQVYDSLVAVLSLDVRAEAERRRLVKRELQAYVSVLPAYVARVREAAGERV